MPERGRVIASHGNRLTIEDEQHRVWIAHTRRNQDRVVCGDIVEWAPVDDESIRVTRLLQRNSLLQCLSANGKTTRPLCANMDRVVIVDDPSRRQGVLQTDLIDRYIAATTNREVKTLIVINKTDLLTEAQYETSQNDIEIYRGIGYRCTEVSAKTGRHIPELRSMLHGHCCIFVGESGTGKSSLINQLTNEKMARTGSMTRDERHGRHTTSTTRLYHIDASTTIMDSPGVRSFIPRIDSLKQIYQGFPEIAPLTEQCRFRNCRHDGDLGCAIDAAAEAGLIHPRRLTSFRDLLATFSNNDNKL